MYFDTHTHIDQADFDDDRDEVVARAHAAGVSAIVAVGTTAAASRKCVELSARHPGVYAAVGIQPNHIAEAEADDWAAIVELAKAPRVVAIGETGLDRYWDFTPFDLQLEYFDRHIWLARQCEMPFIVHMRDCDAEIMTCLRDAADKFGPLRGVMHSFTGDEAMAVQCAELGLHISFAGMVTYKKSDELRACAAIVPADRLLVETDSPYLSPEPVRKVRRNEPAHLVHTVKRIAEVRGTSVEQLGALTADNARRLFRIAA